MNARHLIEASFEADLDKYDRMTLIEVGDIVRLNSEGVRADLHQYYGAWFNLPPSTLFKVLEVSGHNIWIESVGLDSCKRLWCAEKNLMIVKKAEADA